MSGEERDGMMTMVVTKAQEGRSVGELLLTDMALSKRAVTRLKRASEGILVNGHSVTVRRQVATGDVLAVLTRSDGDAPTPVAPLAGMLEVIYEDDDLLVVYKPPQLSVQPRFWHDTDNLGSRVAAYLQQGTEGVVYRPLTRLDKDTSGLVLIAKNAYVQNLLAQSPPIKQYLALVGGDMAEDGVIVAPLGKVGGSDTRRCVRADGKYARTDYAVLARYGTATLLQVTLHTGRTHQIRVHCAYLGHPLLGDALYGGDCTVWRRQALHAWRLQLHQPISGHWLDLCCPFEALRPWLTGL